jgi:hypothetical protein
MAKVKTTIKDIGNTLTSLGTTYTFIDFYQDGIKDASFGALQHINPEVPQRQHVLISLSIKYGNSYEQVAFVNMVHDGSMERTGLNNAMHTEYMVTSRPGGFSIYVENTIGQKLNEVYYTFTIIGV